MWTSVSAADVPVEDRFEWFTEAVSTDLMPVAIDTERAGDFDAWLGELDLGTAKLSAYEFSPLRSRRTPAHIRRGDPEQYQLALVEVSAMRTCQFGRESGPVVDGFVLTNTSAPLACDNSGDDRPTRVVMLQIPRSELALRAERADRLVVAGLPRTGLGAVMADFMTSVRDNGPDCRPEELPVLGRVALDLATAYLADQLGALAATAPEVRARAALEQAKTFIERNLGDPELTPGVVAARLNVSLRSLYALFRDEPEGVAAFIRRRRLERCRDDLARPELRDLPVQTIAVRSGFTSPTVFGRAFRQEFGRTPTEHRRRALGADGARGVERSRTQGRPGSKERP
ncbi:helix-turn-helix transcriptional regulator [Kitasatospora sp. Ki12]